MIRKRMLVCICIFIAMLSVLSVSKHAVADEGARGQSLSVFGAFETGDSVRIDGVREGNLYLLGERVEIRGTVKGDVRTAGEHVVLTGTVEGALEGIAEIVVLSGRVTGDVSFAAERIEITQGAHITGDASLAADRLIIRGRIDGDLEARGDRVELSARVGGDALLAGPKLTVSSAAHISGNLATEGPDEPSLSPGARIDGETRHAFRPETTTAWMTQWRTVGPGFHFGPGLGDTITMAIWALALGAGLILLLPGVTARTASGLRRRPVSSFFLGIVFLAGLIVGGILLFLPIITIPLGLAAILAASVLTILGYTMAAITLSGLLITPHPEDHKMRRVGALAATLAILALLSFVPVLGESLSIALTLAGAGAVGGILFGGGDARAQAAPA